MKKKFIIFLFIIISTGLYAKDYHKTREMIDSILIEESDSATSEKSTKNDNIKSEDQGDEEKTTAEQKDNTETVDSKNKMSDKNDSIFKNATQLYQNGYYDYALIKFNEIIKDHPDSKFIDSAHVYAGRIYIIQYKYDDAIKEFDSVNENTGVYPSSIYYKAEAYRYKGDIIRSIEFYQKLYTEYPTDLNAVYSILNTGKLYLLNNQGTKALEIAAKLIHDYPDRDTIDDAYYLIAKIYEKDPVLKDVETTRKYLKIFLKKAANNEKFFADSPLLPAVKRDLDHLEKTYFRMER